MPGPVRLDLVSSRQQSTTADASNRPSALWIVVSCSAGISAMPLPVQRTVVLGRGTECDVVIDDPSVSRRHATIRAQQVEDLGSRNGTRVAGRQLRRGESVGLDVGQVVELGEATVLLHRGPLPRAERSSRPPSGPVLSDPTMQKMYAMLDVIAPSDLSLVILGETGTGKEVFASYAHERSLRAAAPLLRLNCAALSGSLLESELFGHERGAFTGAVAAKPGLFESANGGTVFLDEIGELPLETQAKLLRVLENGEVIRLGSVKPRHVDVRYVAATNRDLAALAQAGLFRADLFYRLNGVCFWLPPLRRRRSEILPLARHFLEKTAQRAKRPAPAIPERTAAALVAYPWPGNVRELRSVMERAAVLAGDRAEIELSHLLLPTVIEPTEPEPAPRPLSPRETYERERVVEALQRAEGNQTKAAALLGVSRRTFVNKLEKYALERPRKRSRPP